MSKSKKGFWCKGGLSLLADSVRLICPPYRLNNNNQDFSNKIFYLVPLRGKKTTLSIFLCLFGLVQFTPRRAAGHQMRASATCGFRRAREGSAEQNPALSSNASLGSHAILLLPVPAARCGPSCTYCRQEEPGSLSMAVGPGEQLEPCLVPKSFVKFFRFSITSNL